MSSHTVRLTKVEVYYLIQALPKLEAARKRSLKRAQETDRRLERCRPGIVSGLALELADIGELKDKLVRLITDWELDEAHEVEAAKLIRVIRDEEQPNEAARALADFVERGSPE